MSKQQNFLEIGKSALSCMPTLARMRIGNPTGPIRRQRSRNERLAAERILTSLTSQHCIFVEEGKLACADSSTRNSFEDRYRVIGRSLKFPIARNVFWIQYALTIFPVSTNTHDPRVSKHSRRPAQFFSLVLTSESSPANSKFRKGFCDNSAKTAYRHDDVFMVEHCKGV
jgi:hypothetical protein